jgi:hypothetical protein
VNAVQPMPTSSTSSRAKRSACGEELDRFEAFELEVLDLESDASKLDALALGELAVLGEPGSFDELALLAELGTFDERGALGALVEPEEFDALGDLGPFAELCAFTES